MKVSDMNCPLNYVQRYIANFDIEAAALGPLIAEGKQHYTHRYQNDKVIKIPRPSAYMAAYGRFTYQDIFTELTILQDFLGEFLVHTQVLSTVAHDGYIIMQDFLHETEYVTLKNFTLVQRDFIRIAEANRDIIRTQGCSLDLLGNKGLQCSFAASIFRKKELALMNNILVLPREGAYTIKLVDLNLLQLRRCEEISLFRGWVDRSCFELSRYLLKDNFNLEL